MKKGKIILAGGTGFIGQELCNWFAEDNDIVVLTRQLQTHETNAFGANNVRAEVAAGIRYVKWDGINEGVWTKEIEGADMIINLAGKSVNCRYTEQNKKEIFDSRSNTTKAIGLAIQQAVNPPGLWINAASATIYPHADIEPRDESFSNFSNDFSVEVCRLWEKSFYEQQTPFTRKVVLRMAITLGPGGVMVPYFNLLKFGLGGRQGSGKQMYSWVHVDDTCRMVEWIYEHKEMEGTYNCSSPGAVTNKAFMKALRKATGYRCGLPAYEWMLKMGAPLIGTETELVLKSRWVLPTKILQSGFGFKYNTIEDAFKDIIHKTPRRKYRFF